MANRSEGLRADALAQRYFRAFPVAVAGGHYTVLAAFSEAADGRL